MAGRSAIRRGTSGGRSPETLHGTRGSSSKQSVVRHRAKLIVPTRKPPGTPDAIGARAKTGPGPRRSRTGPLPGAKVLRIEYLDWAPDSRATGQNAPRAYEVKGYNNTDAIVERPTIGAQQAKANPRRVARCRLSRARSQRALGRGRAASLSVSHDQHIIPLAVCHADLPIPATAI